MFTQGILWLSRPLLLASSFAARTREDITGFERSPSAELAPFFFSFVTVQLRERADDGKNPRHML